MNAQTEQNTSQIIDIVKQAACGLFLVIGIVAFYHFAQIPLLYRVLGLVLLVVGLLFVLFTTQAGRKAWAFIQESKIEVRKIVWPTREETMRTTLMVFAMVFVVGMVLWFLDMFLFWGIRILTGQGG